MGGIPGGARRKPTPGKPTSGRRTLMTASMRKTRNLGGDEDEEEYGGGGPSGSITGSTILTGEPGGTEFIRTPFTKLRKNHPEPLGGGGRR